MSISGHQNASVFRRYDIIESADQAIALAAADAHRREERAAMKVVGMRKAMAAPPARGQ